MDPREFERMTHEVKERLAPALVEVHRKRASELKDELAQVYAERDEAAKHLKELLETQARLTKALQQEVSQFNPGEADQMALYGRFRLQYWVSDEFEKWLS